VQVVVAEVGVAVAAAAAVVVTEATEAVVGEVREAEVAGEVVVVQVKVVGVGKA